MTELRSCEIECKFKADHISWEDFEKLISKGKIGTFNITDKQLFNGFDDYYGLGESVIRHRYGGASNQLTVKLRKSKTSILNRIEQDLNFSKETTKKDVSNFLIYSGYRLNFSLKKHAIVLWLENKDNIHFTIVLYEVFALHNPTKKMRFLEIEVEKTNNLTQRAAELELGVLKRLVKKTVGVKKAMNKSLYEIFSGKSYGYLNEKSCK
jgi:hypothetical protein